MNQQDTRWRQRFQNFERAYKQFSEAVERFEELNTLEKEGLIQRFEPLSLLGKHSRIS